MVIGRKIPVQAATALLAAFAAFALLLSFASAAQATVRISVAPGLNGPVHAISEPDSNGTRYLGGQFTAFDAWGTGGGALVGASSGDVNTTFPKVNGGIYATVSDGSGGFYIGGSFTCIGPNTSGSCNGADDVVRTRAAHINANGSVDPSWNPTLNADVYAIAVSGSNVYLGGNFSAVSGAARNGAAAVGTDGTLSSWNPNLNNSVYAIGVSGSNVYLGGSFTTAGGTARNRAAAVGTDGTLTAWNPNLNNTVSAIGVSGSNVYLGGAFTTVGGQARNRAAAVTTDGAGTLTDWNPNLSSSVYAIAVSGSNVYLGGNFTTVGGQARNRAAAVTTDGAGTLTSWNPDLNGFVNAIGVSGSNVYLGGNFSTAGGTARNNAAAVTTDGAGTLSSWNPNLNSSVRAIAVSGSNVYLGGYFNTVGGTTRNHAAAVDAAGTPTDWNPNLNGDVFVIAVSGSNVYLGGYFNTVSGTTRNYAAAVDTAGALTSWNPNPNSEVRAIAVSDSTVYLGGFFSTVGGITRNYAAAVDTAGALTSWNPNLNGIVRAIAVSGSTVYLGGFFSTVGGAARNRAAAVDTSGTLTDWNPDLNSYGVNAIAVSDSTVYLGGEFTNVGGITRNNAAAVDTAGTLTSWNPNLNGIVRGSVNAIAVSDSTVYLGGEFTTVGGITRNRAAAVDIDGALTSWNPNLSKPGSGFGTLDRLLAIVVSGSNVYLGGDFTTVGGTTRNYAAAVSIDGVLLGGWPGTPLPPPVLFDLTVSKLGTGGGTITSSPAGIDCGSDCSETLVDGSSVTLTATPATGSTFTGWSGAGCSGTSTCIVTMSEARSVTAQFTADLLLSVTKSGTGSGTVASSPGGIDCGSTCSTTVASGTSVTLTATPATGSSFTGWSGAGCSGTSTCTVTMSEARAVNAEFAAAPPVLFGLTVSKSGAGRGTVTSSPAGIDCGADCSESLVDGTLVTLTASPATGSSFVGWSAGCSGTSTCTVIMSEAKAVNAAFAVVPLGSFNLMVSKSGTGAGTVTSLLAGIDCGSDCSEMLQDGTSVTLTASPAAGSSFTGWSGGCSGISTCTVTMNAARTVTAEFTMPPNIFPTPKVAKVSATTLISTVRVPGPGKLTQLVTRSGTAAAALTVCKTSAKATKAGTVKLTCKLSSATRAALRKRSLRVSVKTTFTPTGGVTANKTQSITLKRKR